MPPTPRRPHVLFATACVLALVACSVESESEPDLSDATESSTALGRGSVGAGNGFTCENGYCICNKSIEGDCDKMRKNCFITSLFKLDKCLASPLPYCTCSMGLVARPERGGVVAGGGGAVATD